MAEILTLTFNPALDLTAGVARVEPHIKLRCHGLRRDPGGGGINVARVIQRLGGNARALYLAGGSPGRLIHDLLDAEGVESLVVPTQTATRENLTVQEEETGLQYRFLLPAEPLCETDLTLCMESLKRIRPKPKLLVASGSLPPGAPEDLLAKVARLCREREIDFALDASGEGLRLALEAGVGVVKMNRRELEDLVGKKGLNEAGLKAAAEQLRDRGAAREILLTLAEEGARLLSPEGALRCPGIGLKVVSAVGAGDSFLAAYLLSRHRGETAGEALRWGVAAGSAALLTPGTQLCERKEVERLFQSLPGEAVADWSF